MDERRIVLDVEGTDSADRGRVIELGMVEMIGRRMTSRSWSSLFWPGDAKMSPFAARVHGYKMSDLHGRPTFSERADEIFAFIGDARIFAHGAASDRAFLNRELAIAGRPALGAERFFDTQRLAAKRFPGQKTSMDALIANVLRKVRPKFHKGIDDARFLAEILSRIAPSSERDLAAYMNDRKTAQGPGKGASEPVTDIGIGEGLSGTLTAAITAVRSGEEATALKVGGHDAWSRVPQEMLDGLLHDLTGRSDYRDHMPDLSPSRQNGVLRWVGRGLGFDIALDRERWFARREEAILSPSP